MSEPSPAPAEVTLHLGDCVEGMRRSLEPGTVDAVVTSPPYNLGTRYSAHDDTSPRSEYLAWCHEWAREVKRTLAPAGSFFLNVGGKPSDPWVAFEVLGVMRHYFALQNVIHWIKSIAVPRGETGNYPGLGTDLVAGHYKPINSPRYLNDCHEYVFHLTHAGEVPLDRLAVGVPYRDKSNVTRWRAARADVHCRGNTWFIPYRTIRSRAGQRPHPATFPPELPERCLRLHGVERIRLVLDPFMGLGNTALACNRLGVPCVGWEVGPEYHGHALALLCD